MPRRRNLLSIGAVGSTSRSLGANDPRLRRNSSQLGVSDIVVSGAVRVDKKQRISIKQADPISEIPMEPTNEELAGSIRELANKLTRAELMQQSMRGI